MLDWLIIGGGIQGTALSNYLVNAYGASPDKLRVLDPHDEPLAQWNHRTRNTGMRYLRSPHQHHLDIEPHSLRDFSRTDPDKQLGGHILPFQRPAYRLFQAHTAQTMVQRGLASLRLKGSAQFIVSTKGGLLVETDMGDLRARRVVLALGRSRLNIPHWAEGVPGIQHIFAPSFDLGTIAGRLPIGVVGGGISAGQVALALAERFPGEVRLLMRHDLRESDLDSSPCWLGPQCKGVFMRAGSPEARRALITQARKPGTMSADVARDVRSAIRDGRIQRIDAAVMAADCVDGQVRLSLAGGSQISMGQVLLATGFASVRPGGAWLDGVIDWFGLPLAPCGYPLVDEQLQWYPGLYAAGGLAELELGPPAANIVGGRLAAERLAPLVEI